MLVFLSVFYIKTYFMDLKRKIILVYRQYLNKWPKKFFKLGRFGLGLKTRPNKKKKKPEKRQSKPNIIS